MADLTIREKTTILACEAILAAVRELRSVPNGVLYAQIMGSISFDDYTNCIGLLVKIGKIRNTNNLLTIV